MTIEKQYGFLTVIKEAKTRPYGGKNKRYLLCKCQCGVIKEFQLSHLKAGASKSCGCFAIQERIKNATKHNGCKEYPKELMIFFSAKARCQNQNNKGYKNYGGRGIQFLYRDFKHFISDLGRKTNEESSLDRINNDGNYEEGNCRWSTRFEQSNNRRNVTWYKGESSSKASLRLGGYKGLVANRLRYGWSIERAFETPFKKPPTKSFPK
jgi:hypothetical protein